MLSPGPLLEGEEELSGLGGQGPVWVQTVGGRQDIRPSLGTHVPQAWAVLVSSRFLAKMGAHGVDGSSGIEGLQQGPQYWMFLDRPQERPGLGDAQGIRPSGWGSSP